jgi:hypothetical protein
VRKRVLLFVLVLVGLLSAASLATAARPPVPTGAPPAGITPLRPGDAGPKVCGLQWELQGQRPSVYRGIITYPRDRARNCYYGPVTARAVYRMKYRLGFPERALNGRAGADFQAILRGKRARPIFYISRAGRRFPVPVPLSRATVCVNHLLSSARAEVRSGSIETWGDNWGPRVRDYQSATGAYHAAWCASFVQWNLIHIGYGAIADHTAGVFYMTDWGRARGLVHALPRVGSIVLFQDQRLAGQGHEGIVVHVTSHGFVSVEGNQANGVHEVYHDLGYRNPVFLWLPDCS